MGRFDNEILAKEKEKLCNSNSDMPFNEIIQIEEELNHDIKILNTLNKLYDSIKPNPTYGSPMFDYNGHHYTLVMTKCEGKNTKHPYKLDKVYKDGKIVSRLAIKKELKGMYSPFIKLGSAFYEDNPSMTTSSLSDI